MSISTLSPTDKYHRETQDIRPTVTRSKPTSNYSTETVLSNCVQFIKHHRYLVWAAAYIGVYLSIDKICALADMLLEKLPFNTHNCPRPPSNDHFPLARAPLTFVRAANREELSISVLYNPKMIQYGPLAPKPAEIQVDKGISTYTWNVLTHSDGTLSARGASGLQERIKMIWWEAMRKEPITRIEPSAAARVERGQLGNFLTATLKKLGVQDHELQPFVEFWVDKFENNYDPQNTPHILVELVKPEDVLKYLPEMKIQSKSDTTFDLNRFYFRFEPTTVRDNKCGIAPETYLKTIHATTLGPNVVIDLGGEIAKAPDVASTSKQQLSDAYNQAFIKKHIYA